MKNGSAPSWLDLAASNPAFFQDCSIAPGGEFGFSTFCCPSPPFSSIFSSVWRQNQPKLIIGCLKLVLGKAHNPLYGKMDPDEEALVFEVGFSHLILHLFIWEFSKLRLNPMPSNRKLKEQKTEFGADHIDAPIAPFDWAIATIFDAMNHGPAVISDAHLHRSDNANARFSANSRGFS